MIDFSSCSLDQLLNMIDKNFYYYVTTKEQMYQYLSCLFIKACESMGTNVSHEKVEFAYLVKSDFGLYDQFTNKMTFNKKPIECFDTCKIKNNTFFPFRLAQTALHEARHYAQHNNSESVDDYLRKFAKFAKTYCNFIAEYQFDYSTNPLEVDARHYAYTILAQYPYLQNFLLNQKYIESEKKRSVGYSSIYSLYLKTNSAMLHYTGKRDEKSNLVLTNLGDASVDFLIKNNLDPKEFANALLQYTIQKDNTIRLRFNQKEKTMLEQESNLFDKEFAQKIFSDKIVSSEDLLKCHDKMYSLNARPQMIDRAYYKIRLNTYKARETRTMYKQFAPNFVKLLQTNISTPAPYEEQQFFSDYEKF